MASPAYLQVFDNMMGVYQRSGGTATADELSVMMERKQQGNFISVARQIASRDIFSFEWQNHFWIPMFQFNPLDLSIKLEVRKVVYELTDVLDSWTLAEWFTAPNAWLEGGRPVDMVDSNFLTVLGAARADRFVATG